MKKLIYIIAAFSVFLFFTSCNKYEEGPALSLRSAEKRLTGIHLLEKYIVNDKEIPLSDLGITEERVIYYKNGSGEKISKYYDFEEVKRNFEWEFDKKKENIRTRELGLNGEWGSWTPYRKILRLTNKEFWIVEPDSQETVELHYVKQ